MKSSTYQSICKSLQTMLTRLGPALSKTTSIDVTEAVSIYHKPVNCNSHSMDLVALEDRILFDAAPMDVEFAVELDANQLDATAEFADAVNWAAGVAPGLESPPLQFDARTVAERTLELIDQLEAADFDSQATNQTMDSSQVLVVVDSSVDNDQSLINSFTDSTTDSITTIIIDSAEDGIRKISAALSELGSVESLHVFSHATTSGFQLGDSIVDATTLGQYTTQIQSWQDYLTEGADILFYGCDLAAESTGQQLLSDIAEMSGADIAASIDLTGHASLGGDWILEYQIGEIHTDGIVSAAGQVEWQFVLPVAVMAELETPIDNALNNTLANQNRGSTDAVAMDGDGNYVVVWASDTPLAGWEVRAQRYDFLGNAVGSEISVNQSTAGDQYWATVAMDKDGDFVVTWTDRQTDDVMYRQFYAAGGDSGEIRANEAGTFAENSSLAMNKDGLFSIVWQGDSLDVGEDGAGIYGSYFDEDGIPIFQHQWINENNTIGLQFDADVAINNGEEVAFVWTDSGGIYGQRFDKDGNRLGNEDWLAANDFFPGLGYSEPAVALRDDGVLLVAHTQDGVSGTVVVVSYYDENNQWLDFSYANQTVADSQFGVSIELTIDDGYLVVWQGNGDQPGELDNAGVFYRVFDKDFGPLDGSTETRVNQYTSGGQGMASVAALDSAHFVVAWSGEISATNTSSVTHRLYSDGSTNQQPTAIDSLATINEGEDYTFVVEDFGYFDLDDDPLAAIRITDLPSEGDLFIDEILAAQNDLVSLSNISTGKLIYQTTSPGRGAGFDSFEFSVSDGDEFSSNVAEMQIDVIGAHSLLFSTRDDVTGATDVPGIDDWAASNVLEFGGPDLDFDGTTAGELFAHAFDLQNFTLTPNANIDALHYVTETITLGSTSQITLNPGDIIFSTTLDLNLPGIGSLVEDSDLLVFQPAAADYASGAFTLLFDSSNQATGIDDLVSMTLVETGTEVGGVQLEQGDFLFTATDGSLVTNIYVMSLSDVGENTSAAAFGLLTDTADYGINTQIVGMDLIERDVTIGNVDLQGGQLVLSMMYRERVGANGEWVRPQDAFVFDMDTGEADKLFDGSLVGFDNVEAETELFSLSLFSRLDTYTNAPPTVADQPFSIFENSPVATLVGQIVAADPDNGDYVQFDVSGGSGSSIFAVDEVTGEITVVDTNALDFESGTTSYELLVLVTDAEGLTDAATITITVDDVYEASIAGVIYHDVDGDGSFADDLQYFESAQVHLYADSNGNETFDSGDTLVASQFTDASGNFEFESVGDGDYFVVVDSTSLVPHQGLNSGTLNQTWAQQTYGSAGSLQELGGVESQTTGGVLYGGRNAEVSDDLTTAATAQHVTYISLAGADASSVDSAFSFNVVTNLLGGNSDNIGRSDQGSFRQFLQNANEIVGENRMRFVPLVDPNSLGGTTWRLDVFADLPVLVDDFTMIDGQAYTAGITTTTYAVSGVTAGIFGHLIDPLETPDFEIANGDGVRTVGLQVLADDVSIEGVTIEGFGDPGDWNSGNVFTLDSDNFSLTNSVLTGAGHQNLLVRGGDFGIVRNNLIEGAGVYGIRMDGSSPIRDWVLTENVIRDNSSLLSSGDGIDLQENVTFTYIGQNSITGNRGNGIDTWQNDGHVTIEENTISGNGWGNDHTAGVRLWGHANFVEHNVISNNTGAGVLVLGDVGEPNSPAQENRISQNSFGGNGTIAIDLTEANLTDPDVRDQGDGVSIFSGLEFNAANDGIQSPVILSATLDGGNTVITGTAGANQRIELYIAVSDSDGSDAFAGGEFGEGVLYLDWVMTDALGNFTFNTSALGVDDSVTAIAIDAVNNTSEFSQNIDVNVAPTTTGFNIALYEGDTYTFAPSQFAFSDADMDAFAAVVLKSLPASGLGVLLFDGLPANVGDQISYTSLLAGELTLVAPMAVSGTTSFDFAVSDGQADSDSKTISVTVDPLPIAPVITTDPTQLVAENESFIVDIEVFDPDSTDVEFSLLNSGKDEALFAIDRDGNLEFNNPPDYELPLDPDHEYEVDVMAEDDSGETSVKTFFIQVTPENDNEPEIGNDSKYNVDENTVTVTTLIASDEDIPNDLITFSIDPGFGDGSQFVIDSTTNELKFVVPPDYELPTDDNANNIYVLRVEAFDGVHTVVKKITVKVLDVNEPITSVGLDNDTVYENSSGGTRVGFVEAVDPDVGDRHTYELLDDADGRFQINRNTGELTVAAAADLNFEAVKNHSIEVRVTDDALHSMTTTFTISVLNVNEVPVATNDVVNVDEGGRILPADVNVFDNDFDPDLEPFFSRIVSGPSHGTLFWVGDGTFKYMHDGSELGFDSFVYQIIDAGGKSDTAVVQIVVNPVNDAPFAVDDELILVNSEPVVITPEQLLGNDMDPDSAALFVQSISSPSSGSLVLLPDGSLLFTPDPDFMGVVSFSYIASDGLDPSNFGQVELVSPIVTTETDPTNDSEDNNDENTSDESTDDTPDAGSGGNGNEVDAGKPEESAGPVASDSGNDQFVDSFADAKENESEGYGFGPEDYKSPNELLSANYVFSYQTSSWDLTSLLLQSEDSMRQMLNSAFDESTFSFATMWSDLDNVKESLMADISESTGAIATAAGLTGFLTVGYVFCLAARGGMLVASLVSVPAWQSLDPLPVLQFAADEDDDEQGDSIESLLSNSSPENMSSQTV